MKDAASVIADMIEELGVSLNEVLDELERRGALRPKCFFAEVAEEEEVTEHMFELETWLRTPGKDSLVHSSVFTTNAALAARDNYSLVRLLIKSAVDEVSYACLRNEEWQAPESVMFAHREPIEPHCHRFVEGVCEYCLIEEIEHMKSLLKD